MRRSRRRRFFSAFFGKSTAVSFFLIFFCGGCRRRCFFQRFFGGGRQGGARFFHVFSWGRWERRVFPKFFWGVAGGVGFSLNCSWGSPAATFFFVPSFFFGGRWGRRIFPAFSWGRCQPPLQKYSKKANRPWRPLRICATIKKRCRWGFTQRKKKRHRQRSSQKKCGNNVPPPATSKQNIRKRSVAAGDTIFPPSPLRPNIPRPTTAPAGRPPRPLRLPHTHAPPPLRRWFLARWPPIDCRAQCQRVGGGGNDAQLVG